MLWPWWTQESAQRRGGEQGVRETWAGPLPPGQSRAKGSLRISELDPALPPSLKLCLSSISPSPSVSLSPLPLLSVLLPPVPSV